MHDEYDQCERSIGYRERRQLRAVSIRTAHCKLRDSTLDGNTAAGHGGGLYNTATTSLTNNRSPPIRRRKAVAFYNTFTATISNNLIALNTAPTD